MGTVIVMRGSEDENRSGDGGEVVELSRNSSIAPSYETKTFTE